MKPRRNLPKRSTPKPKKSKAPALPKLPALPDWLNDESVSPPCELSPQELTTLAKNVRRGIRDTPAWRALVKRHGSAAAFRVLKLALYSRHIIRGNPRN